MQRNSEEKAVTVQAGRCRRQEPLIRFEVLEGLDALEVEVDAVQFFVATLFANSLDGTIA